MTLQMIANFDTADFDAWKSVFDHEGKDLAGAGLTVQHIWQEADTPDRAWILLSVRDREHAETWLAGDAVTGAERAGITNLSYVFLDPA